MKMKMRMKTQSLTIDQRPLLPGLYVYDANSFVM
jgi:hypothetical protein